MRNFVKNNPEMWFVFEYVWLNKKTGETLDKDLSFEGEGEDFLNFIDSSSPVFDDIHLNDENVHGNDIKILELKDYYCHIRYIDNGVSPLPKFKNLGIDESLL